MDVTGYDQAKIDNRCTNSRPVDLTGRIGSGMRNVQPSEAKTHLPRVRNELERGETIIITRHGFAIARVLPQVSRCQAEIA